MADFMPQVLQVLFTNIEENSQKPCYDTFGVCEPSETSTEYAYDAYDDNFDSITLTKRAVLKDLYERIRGDDYFENQVKLLKKDVCPFFPDIEKCESEVDMSWKYFSEGLFTNDSADDFCTYPDNNCDTEKYVVQSTKYLVQ